MSTYTLHNTFSDRIVSKHRSLEAAVKAEHQFLASVRRSNGAGSYIPTAIRCDGSRLTVEQCEERDAIRLNLETAL